MDAEHLNKKNAGKPSQATAEMNFARIWCIPNATPAGLVTPPRNVYMAKFDPGWEGYTVWQTGLLALAGHSTHHVNVIKLTYLGSPNSM